MMYLLPGKSSLIQRPAYFGSITTPHNRTPPRPIKEGRPFAVDNECFTKPFNVMRMAELLKNSWPHRHKCLFVVVPDIPWHNGQRVFDATITLEMFDEYATHPIFNGWPLAYVAQNGAESLPIPDAASAVFIGGDTDWKESDAALSVIYRAQDAGLWTHVGRVNSHRRIKHFQIAGVDSVDGTGLVFAPDRVMEQLTRWLAQPSLVLT